MSANATIESATIRTGARLHFGLLANRPESGREFGGIGLMISEPGWTIRVTRAATDSVEASTAARTSNPEAEQRAARFLAHVRSSADVAESLCDSAASCGATRPQDCGDESLSATRTQRRNEPAAASVAVRIEIESAIPGHQGLGSGTQLALAIAKGIALLEGRDAPSDELARRIGRGKRSAIGIWGFDHGGFLVEGGKLPSDEIGVLIGRFDVPTDWRFVLVSPRAQAGLSGADELAAFKSLPPMSPSITQRLSQLVLTSILPALRQSRFDEFSSALFDYGRAVGEYFGPAQGGIFASRLMSQLSDQLARLGHARPVQTSWGPTCAIPCRDVTETTAVSAAVQSSLGADAVDIRVATALAQGALISMQ